MRLGGQGAHEKMLGFICCQHENTKYNCSEVPVPHREETGAHVPQNVPGNAHSSSMHKGQDLGVPESN